jgi:hypothetical protein
MTDTTIGYAVLQIIPSLKGVTEAIEKQIAGQVIPVTIEPKFPDKGSADRKKLDKAISDAVKKAPVEVPIEPKMDAGKVGKQINDAAKKAGQEVKSQKLELPPIDVGKVREQAKKAGTAISDVIKDAKNTKLELPQFDPSKAREQAKGAGKAISEALNDALSQAAQAQGVSVDELKVAIGEKIGQAVGAKIGEAIRNIPGVAPIIDQIQQAAPTLQSLGDAMQGLRDHDPGAVLAGVDGALRNIGQSAAADHLQRVAASVGNIATLGKGARENLQGIADSGKGIGGLFDKIGHAGGLISNVTGTVVELSDINRYLRDNFTWLDRFENKLFEGGNKKLPAEESLQNIATYIAAIPPDKEIRVRTLDNGVEDQLKSWGFQVTHLPNGIITITADTTSAKEKVAFWRSQEVQNPIDMKINPDTSSANTKMEEFVNKWTNALISPHVEIRTPGAPDPNIPGAPPMPSLPPGWKPGMPIPGRQSGGPITGPGSGTSDSILGWPAMVRVSNGEFVTNEKDTTANLPLLQAVNSGAPLWDWMKSLPRFDTGGLVAGSAQLRKIISERFGIADIGGYRPADKYGEHSTGRALDVMVGSDKAKGDAVKDFALANAPAIDLKWVIWRQHLYYAGGGGYDMEDRGNPTQNHMDHVHIFSGTGIINGLLGALQGGPNGRAATAAPAALNGDDGARPGAASPAGGVAAPAGGGAPASPAGAGGLSIPASLSGLSSWGFDALGSGAKNEPGNRDPLAYFSKAAGAAVSGQVSSALGVFGVPDSPGWLQGISKFVGGISIGGPGSGGPGAGGSLGAIPSALRAGAPRMPAAVPAAAGAGQQPGPQTIFNIQTDRVEDAFIRAENLAKEKALSKLGPYG